MKLLSECTSYICHVSVHFYEGGTIPLWAMLQNIDDKIAMQALIAVDATPQYGSHLWRGRPALYTTRDMPSGLMASPAIPCHHPDRRLPAEGGGVG